MNDCSASSSAGLISSLVCNSSAPLRAGCTVQQSCERGCCTVYRYLSSTCQTELCRVLIGCVMSRLKAIFPFGGRFLHFSMHTPVWLHEQAVTNTEWLSSLNWSHTLCLSLIANKLKQGTSDDENVLCIVPQLLQSLWLPINQSKVAFSHLCKPKSEPEVLLEHYSVIRNMYQILRKHEGVNKCHLNLICVTSLVCPRFS